MGDQDPIGFLGTPPVTAEAQSLFDGDEQGMGYVMNVTRLWAHRPELLVSLSDFLAQVTKAGGLSLRHRGVLVTAAAATLGDSYCSLAWGRKLAEAADPATAAAVLRGQDDGLDPTDQALARWARRVAADPNAITAADVEALRAAGFDDAQVLAITTFVALRLAFSTVNDALGVLPDHQVGTDAPEEVRAAVTYGRPVARPDS
jgi:uncharacterized peroxidase-related enzyme